MNCYTRPERFKAVYLRVQQTDESHEFTLSCSDATTVQSAIKQGSNTIVMHNLKPVGSPSKASIERLKALEGGMRVNLSVENAEIGPCIVKNVAILSEEDLSDIRISLTLEKISCSNFGGDGPPPSSPGAVGMTMSLEPSRPSILRPEPLPDESCLDVQMLPTPVITDCPANQIFRPVDPLEPEWYWDRYTKRMRRKGTPYTSEELRQIEPEWQWDSYTKTMRWKGTPYTSEELHQSLPISLNESLTTQKTDLGETYSLYESTSDISFYEMRIRG